MKWVKYVFVLIALQVAMLSAKGPAVPAPQNPIKHSVHASHESDSPSILCDYESLCSENDETETESSFIFLPSFLVTQFFGEQSCHKAYAIHPIEASICEDAPIYLRIRRLTI